MGDVETETAIEAARAARDALVRALAGARGGEVSVDNRAAMLSGDTILRIALEAALAALGWRRPAAVRHLEWAPIGRARLESALVGVPDALLDRPAASGAWSIRRQLAHVELTDVRYGIATRYGAERRDDEPIAPPASFYPPRDADPIGNPGEPLAAIVARLRRVRAAVIAPLLGIPEDRLQRSVEWHTADHTVGFRLHRFAQHDLEIATDVRATLAALGFAPTPTQRIAAALLASWGEIEAALLGVPTAVLSQRAGTARGPRDLLLEARDTDVATLAAVQR